jgi:hypothetical protein
MRHRNFLIAVLALGIAGLVSPVVAQQDGDSSQYQPAPQQNKTVLDKLGDLGRSIFGDDQPTPTPQNYSRPQQVTDAPAPRSGSVSSPSTVRSPISQLPDEPPADMNSYPSRPATVHSVSNSSQSSIATPADSAPAPAAQPLHERLQSFRQSVFDSDSSSKPAASSASDPPVITSVNQPSRIQAPTTATRTAISTYTPPVVPLAPAPMAAATEKDLEFQPKLIAPTKAKLEPAPEGDANVIFARKSPVLSVETKGPRRISIGKEAAYEVTIQNSGDVAAEELIVLIGLPPWADVAAAEASAGTTHVTPPGAVGEPFQWNVGHLDGKSKEKLVLRLVPRQSRPFDLAVRWDYKPAASQAMIEVQEPKLAVHLDGPSEVLYGKKELFRLKISNVGTGPAENVLISLLPVGTGENRPVTHHMAILAAGEERVMEAARQAR